MFYALFILSLILFAVSFYFIGWFNIWFYESKIDEKIYKILIHFDLAVGVVSAYSCFSILWEGLI